MYKKAGINDVADFYKSKFAVPAKSDFTDNALNFFDINYFKMLWVFSKVTEGAKVLDFGCGSGALSCLKKKNCHITGIDLSHEALEIAKNYNFYDSVFCGDIFSFKHERNAFDYVVSLDVFGHIPFEEKDEVILRLKELLKPGGVMLNGIECGHCDYDSMSSEQLKQFITVDGHVGIEGKQENIDRFKKYFAYVKGEVRYNVVNSAEEYLKQAEHYDATINDTMLLFLKTLDYFERRIFNIASGFSLINMANKNIPSSDEHGGFLFLEASDDPLPSREIETPEVSKKTLEDNLIRDQQVFCKGWYDVEQKPKGLFRWGMKRSYIYLPSSKGALLYLSIFTSYPKVFNKKVEVFFIDHSSRKIIIKIILNSANPCLVTIPVDNDGFILEIFVDTTWIPRLMLSDSGDERELGIGLDNIQIAFPTP